MSKENSKQLLTPKLLEKLGFELVEAKVCGKYVDAYRKFSFTLVPRDGFFLFRWTGGDTTVKYLSELQDLRKGLKLKRLGTPKVTEQMWCDKAISTFRNKLNESNKIKSYILSLDAKKGIAPTEKDASLIAKFDNLNQRLTHFQVSHKVGNDGTSNVIISFDGNSKSYTVEEFYLSQNVEFDSVKLFGYSAKQLLTIDYEIKLLQKLYRDAMKVTIAKFELEKIASDELFFKTLEANHTFAYFGFFANNAFSTHSCGGKMRENENGYYTKEKSLFIKDLLLDQIKGVNEFADKELAFIKKLAIDFFRDKGFFRDETKDISFLNYYHYLMAKDDGKGNAMTIGDNNAEPNEFDANIKRFEQKHDVTFESWLAGDDLDAVAMFLDGRCLNYSDIMLDLQRNAEKHLFFGWYDADEIYIDYAKYLDEKSTETDIKRFKQKHDMEFEFWVNGEIGGTASINGFYLDYSNIALDLQRNAEKHLIFEWHDAEIEAHEKGEMPMTYAKYLDAKDAANSHLAQYEIK